jgi:hypothetical protein
MRINDLFEAINKSPKLGAVPKRMLYSTVRAILDTRRKLKIDNNVAALYNNSDIVEEALASEIEDIGFYLDIILTLPEVVDYVAKNTLANNDNEDEEDEDDEDEDEDEDDYNSDEDSEDDIKTEPVNVTVNVNVPFSWVFALTMVASITNVVLTFQLLSVAEGK